jgi:hypothetical protein
LISRLLLASILVCSLNIQASDQVKLPSVFKNNRIFVVPTLKSSEPITFYTDTGGGMNMVTETASSNFSLVFKEFIASDKSQYKAMHFPSFNKGKSIPPPSHKYWGNGGLIEVDDSKLSEDGFLGARWFADKVWRLNYLESSFYFLPDGIKTELNGYDEVPLGFQVNSEGIRTMNFPRISVTIDGEPLELLFDTGATITVSEDAAKELPYEKGTEIGGSYIIRSLFEKWRNSNPDWLVVERGDLIRGHTFPMIQVPTITVGGLSTGPVWFAVRNDQTFTGWMSNMMDKPISGAIGGSGLKYYNVVIDYPKAKAYFSISSQERNQSLQ